MGVQISKTQSIKIDKLSTSQLIVKFQEFLYSFLTVSKNFILRLHVCSEIKTLMTFLRVILKRIINSV
jgi:hypothetical protein